MSHLIEGRHTSHEMKDKTLFKQHPRELENNLRNVLQLV